VWVRIVWSMTARELVTCGSAGGQYYERIDDNGSPNDGHTLCVANGGGCIDERDVVDAGFLDLVRLGVKPPNDFHVTASLPVVDQTIRTRTPEGDLWHRYNHDGYGETTSGAPFTGGGVGRLWPVLGGERGEYALAAGQPAGAAAALATMAGAANQGLLIPEQVWDQPNGSGFTLGQGTGSATPLAWSMAQFVRLAVSISAGRDVETPAVVAARYVAARTVTVTVPASTDGTGRTVFLAGTLSAGLGPARLDRERHRDDACRRDALDGHADRRGGGAAAVQVHAGRLRPRGEGRGLRGDRQPRDDAELRLAGGHGRQLAQRQPLRQLTDARPYNCSVMACYTPPRCP
jgi:hypothetical protein